MPIKLKIGILETTSTLPWPFRGIIPKLGEVNAATVDTEMNMVNGGEKKIGDLLLWILMITLQKHRRGKKMA